MISPIQFVHFHSSWELWPPGLILTLETRLEIDISGWDLGEGLPG